MRIRYLLLCALALVASAGLCAASRSNDTNQRSLSLIVVVQSTPGDGLVHRTFDLNDSDEDGTIRVGPPRAWSIYLTGPESFVGGMKGGSFTKGIDSESANHIPILIWARPTAGSLELVYSRFEHDSWTSPLEVSSDSGGEMGSRWWSDSVLSFVQGTPGDINPHLPVISIDTNSKANESLLPVRAWTVFVDNTILVLPSTRLLRDGEPSLGATLIGEAVVPTVTWAHASAPGNHDPVVARFVNGAWTLAEAITTSSSDDLEPRIAQDRSGTVHAAWMRPRQADGSDSVVLYANLAGGSGLFSTEERASRSEEKAGSPTIAVHPEGRVFIAYESDRGGSTGRVVVARRVARGHGSEGFSFRHHIVARTSGEPANPELVWASGERLLLTWRDSPSRIGISFHARGKWSAPAYETIRATETPADARNRVKAAASISRVDSRR